MTTVPVGQSRTDAVEFVRPRAVSAPHPPAQHERDYLYLRRGETNEFGWYVITAPDAPTTTVSDPPRRDNAQRFSVPARW